MANAAFLQMQTAVAAQATENLYDSSSSESSSLSGLSDVSDFDAETESKTAYKLRKSTERRKNAEAKASRARRVHEARRQMKRLSEAAQRSLAKNKGLEKEIEELRALRSEDLTRWEEERRVFAEERRVWEEERRVWGEERGMMVKEAEILQKEKQQLQEQLQAEEERVLRRNAQLASERQQNASKMQNYEKEIEKLRISGAQRAEEYQSGVATALEMAQKCEDGVATAKRQIEKLEECRNSLCDELNDMHTDYAEALLQHEREQEELAEALETSSKLADSTTTRLETIISVQERNIIQLKHGLIAAIAADKDLRAQIRRLVAE